MKVYVESTDDNSEEKKDRVLPDLQEGDEIIKKEIEPAQHFTQPPPRYTEARLVKTLEELGIGRPSTFAPTLDTIQKRGYVALENKRFVPTELGEIVMELMVEFFPEIIDVEFTAKMERDLDHVEDGQVNWVQIIDDFYKDFESILKKLKKKCKKWKSKMNLQGKIVNIVGTQWSLKWGAMENLWRAVIFRTVEIQRRL